MEVDETHPYRSFRKQLRDQPTTRDVLLTRLVWEDDENWLKRLKHEPKPSGIHIGYFGEDGKLIEV